MSETSERTPVRTYDRWTGTKDSTFENIEVPEELGPIQVTVDERRVKQYAFCMDDYHEWHLSTSPFGGPVAHAALLANDLLTVYYTNYDRSTVTGLHTEEQLWFLRPVPVGETVTITGRFVDKYERRGNGYVVMEAEGTDSAGNVLVRHRGIEIMRVHPGGVVGRGEAAPTERIVPEARNLEPVSGPSRGLGTGIPVTGSTKFLTQEQQSVYSFVGEHERNFHNDLELARAGGLDDTIAQGLQTAGYYSEVCTRFFGADWFTSGWVKAKFVKPVFPNSEIAVRGKIAGQESNGDGYRTHLELWSHDQNDRLVSVAWASAVTDEAQGDHST